LTDQIKELEGRLAAS